MRDLTKIFIAMTSIALSASSINANAADKVVVIPLFGDDAKCEWRVTGTEPLDTFYKGITSSCLADEKIITGGFRYATYNTTKNCRVIASYPIFKDDGFEADGWRVTWGQPDTTECATATARTHALCCK